MKLQKVLFIFLFLISSNLILGGVSIAVENTGTLNESTILELLNEVEQELKRQPVHLEKLDEYLISLPRISAWSRDCERAAEKNLEGINSGLAVLGEEQKQEPVEVTNKRNSLLQKKAIEEKKISSCRVASLRSEEAIVNINKVKQALLTKQLLSKGPGFFELLSDNWHHPTLWFDVSKSFIVDHSGLDKLSLIEFILFLIVVAAGTGSGFYLKYLLKKSLAKHTSDENYYKKYYLAFANTLKRYLPVFMASASAAVFMYAVTRQIKPAPFISIVCYGLPFILVFISLIHFSLRACLESGAMAPENESVAKVLARRLKVLVALIFVGYLLFSTIITHSLPEAALLITRAIYAVTLVINLGWIFWLFGRFNKVGGRFMFRLLVIAVFAAVLVAEFNGYRHLSLYMFQVLIGTLISLGLFKWLSDYNRELIEALEYGRSNWQKKIHSLVGVNPEEPLPGMVWIRFIINLLIWTTFFVILMLIWQVPESYFRVIVENISSGFKIGSFEIFPFQIIQAIFVLVILLTLNSWFRRHLAQRWLSKITLERGARESVVAITGYVGLAIAFIIALSVAGMDFSKLAIIAGALSVGIGFGLQNIVNNFISGLILLFERPVKTGDWVIVGSVEGYVKKISIRSTQIQTFDRADVIVPNSELISGNVTNLMLHDMRGRIRVPVGVAYGSDTEKVKSVLLKIANDHPEVLVGGIVDPEPKVLFMGFGDSSLDFELRCYIKNIDSRLSTISDINFAIDAAFRENNIEIPFPQRDVHVRDVPPQSSVRIRDDSDGQSRD